MEAVEAVEAVPKKRRTVKAMPEKESCEVLTSPAMPEDARCAEEECWSADKTSELTDLVLDAINNEVSRPHYNNYLTGNESVMLYRDSKGRGCYAGRSFKKDDLIEICPVIVTPGNEKFGDVMQRYVWGYRGGHMIALGIMGSLVNHTNSSDKANVKADINYEKGTIAFLATKEVREGEELLVCYAIGYPMGEGLGDLSTFLGEMNTAVIVEFEKRQRATIKQFAKALHKRDSTPEEKIAAMKDLLREMENRIPCIC